MKFGVGDQDTYVKIGMMVLVITILFFVMSPGIIWHFPEKLVCNADGTPNKINVISHGVLFSFILVFFYESIQKVIYKN